MLKGTHALGFARATENVTITTAWSGGYDVGLLLDGTYKRTVVAAPDQVRPHRPHHDRTDPAVISATSRSQHRLRSLPRPRARIGGWSEYRRCRRIQYFHETGFERAVFHQAGRQNARARRRSHRLDKADFHRNVDVYDDLSYGSIISGIPGHDIEEVKLSDIRTSIAAVSLWMRLRNNPPDLVNTFFSAPPEACRPASFTPRPSAKVINTPNHPCSACYRLMASSSATPRESS